MNGGAMFKTQSINSYALIVGLAAVFFLPMTAAADRAADRAMKEDGRGLESTRGNNSVAESLRQADGHPVGAHADSPHMAPPTGEMHGDIARPDMNPGVYTPHGGAVGAGVAATQHPTNSPAAPAPGMSGAAITGSDSVVCGGFNNKVMAEINCLRRHLDTTEFRSNRRSSNDLGNYGCGNRADRHQQVHCLRNILDGNGLAPGTQP